MYALDIDDMMVRIIGPLRRQVGIEALHGVIYEAEKQLRNGLLTNRWEVEAMMISMAEVSLVNHCLYFSG